MCLRISALGSPKLFSRCPTIMTTTSSTGLSHHFYNNLAKPSPCNTRIVETGHVGIEEPFSRFANGASTARRATTAIICGSKQFGHWSLQVILSVALLVSAMGADSANKHGGANRKTTDVHNKLSQLTWSQGTGCLTHQIVHFMVACLHLMQCPYSIVLLPSFLRTTGLIIGLQHLGQMV